MEREPIVEMFSTHRLGGEPVPADVAILLGHARGLRERTGIELNAEKDWAPWLDTSYLTPTDRANLDIMANVRSIAEVCELIAFVAADEDCEYYGYWRGPGRRAVADSPLVLLDNEGTFTFCDGSNFAEAVLGRTYGDAETTELRDWFRSLGIVVRPDGPQETTFSAAGSTPDELHHALYDRYRREAGLE